MLPKDNRALLKAGDHALNSLTFQQQQVSIFLGHSLSCLYEDVLKAPIPVHLQAIAARLETKPGAEPEVQNKLPAEQQP